MKKILFLFLLALALRLIFMGAWHTAGRGERLSSDSQSYVDIARNLAAGEGFLAKEKFPTARRPPLYPVMIAALLKMQLPFPVAVQIIQAFLGSFSVVLLFWMGKEVLDAHAGFWAAFFLAIDYESIRNTVAILSETLFIFCVIASFLFLYRAARNPMISARLADLGDPLFAGILAGLALLTRDVLIFFFPLAAAWFFLGVSPKKAAARAGLYLFALMLIITPWMVRNTLLFKKLCLITMSGGYTFYLANNPYATGGRTGGDWEINKDTRYPENSDSMRSKGPSEENEYLMKLGLKFVSENPGQFMGLTFQKILNTWRPFQTDAHPMTRLVQGISYLAILSLAGAGIYQSRRSWLEFLPLYGLFVYVFLLHAVLISGIRYRLPVMPFLMLFAGLALSRVRWARKLCTAE